MIFVIYIIYIYILRFNHLLKTIVNKLWFLMFLQFNSKTKLN